MKDAADPDGLPFVRASDLDDPDESSSWLVEGLWARAGVGIVGGAPKCCKSWLALDLALSVASATPCLGTFPVVDPGGALIYMAEDSSSVVRARLEGICRHRRLDLAALPIDVIVAPSVRLDLARDQDRLAHTVRALRPRLLLLDPFVRLHRIDENHAGDVSTLLAYLRELQRANDLAVVVVHHARKNGPSGAQSGQGLRGSGDFHAWVDSALYLRRRPSDLLLTVEHRAAAARDPLALALVATDATTHLEITGGAHESAPHPIRAFPTIDAAVLHAIEQADHPLSRADLRSALHVRNQTLGDALDRLLAAGHLARDGDRWRRSAVPVPPPAQEAERNATAT